jgi:hypothetical protein
MLSVMPNAFYPERHIFIVMLSSVVPCLRLLDNLQVRSHHKNRIIHIGQCMHLNSTVKMKWWGYFISPRLSLCVKYDLYGSLPELETF